MPVMVLYKDKAIPLEAAEAMIKAIATVMQELLGATIEVRVVEPIYMLALMKSILR